jgi:glycosyltransferase involved in cell wall biosynthesis
MNSRITNTASYAPIALFVYNRPDHARQTIEALNENELSAESDLIIFADGPKNSGAQAKVNEVRELIKNVSGFRSLTIYESPNNKGLANSIIDGVTKVCEEYGRIIVLEDDLVTSPWFLKYMNDALNVYEHDERVISVHGYIYPVDEPLPETFFLRGADCWGWATWRRGWELFEPNGAKLLAELRQQKTTRQFDYDGAYPFTHMLEDQIAGRNDSWAIRWHAAAFLANCLTLYPGKSLIDNIGTDASGTHGRKTNRFTGNFAQNPISVIHIPFEESGIAYKAFARFLRTCHGGLARRALYWIRRAVGA